MTERENEQIWEEASQWFIECRTESLGRDAQEELMRWLRRSPEHIRAYIEVSRTYVGLPPPGLLTQEETDRLARKIRSRPIEPTVIGESRPAHAIPRQSPGPARWGPSVAWLAGAVLALSMIVVIWSRAERGLYSTQAGEQRVVTLSDGSRVELNGRTRLRVSYQAMERRIRLMEGQAYFQVAKDKTRPFIVDTGMARIRAVGTAFDVDRRTADTTITVVEGTVAVVPSDGTFPAPIVPDGSKVMLTAGQQAVITAKGSGSTSAANVPAATAWTRGQLEFNDTPLAQVAEEFNRSNPRQLVLESDQVRSVRISGIYSSADASSLILFLRSQPDLEVHETSDRIVVRAKSP